MLGGIERWTFLLWLIMVSKMLDDQNICSWIYFFWNASGHCIYLQSTYDCLFSHSIKENKLNCSSVAFFEPWSWLHYLPQMFLPVSVLYSVRCCLAAQPLSYCTSDYSLMFCSICILNRGKNTSASSTEQPFAFRWINLHGHAFQKQRPLQMPVCCWKVCWTGDKSNTSVAVFSASSLPTTFLTLQL